MSNSKMPEGYKILSITSDPTAECKSLGMDTKRNYRPVGWYAITKRVSDNVAHVHGMINGSDETKGFTSPLEARDAATEWAYKDIEALKLVLVG